MFSYLNASAGIYRWVDDNGRIHFSDSKPSELLSKEIKLKVNSYRSVKIEPSTFTDKTTKRQKPQSKKVVMYSTSWCGYCKKARTYFKKNRIKFTDYDVETSAKGKYDYKKMGGKGVPIIFVGKRKMTGFTEASFREIYN